MVTAIVFPNGEVPRGCPAEQTEPWGAAPGRGRQGRKLARAPQQRLRGFSHPLPLLEGVIQSQAEFGLIAPGVGRRARGEDATTDSPPAATEPVGA